MPTETSIAICIYIKEKWLTKVHNCSSNIYSNFQLHSRTIYPGHRQKWNKNDGYFQACNEPLLLLSFPPMVYWHLKTKSPN